MTLTQYINKTLLTYGIKVYMIYAQYRYINLYRCE